MLKGSINKYLIILLVAGIVIGVIFLNSYKDPYSSFDLPDQVDFNYHIRPILSQNCYVCHGPDSSSRKANLRLDTYEGATAKLKHGGVAIMPRHVNRSILIDRISSEDPNMIMPPPELKKVLSQREIALIQKWIKQGAKWKPHWAFIQPRFKPPDELNNLSNPTKVIDYFLNSKHAENKLQAAPQADLQTLIRRVAYILTGLPPSSKDLERFKKDNSDELYNRLVDYYLSSPHFGERWARHWMDLTRYAEFMGHEFDYPINGAWHYRDYLIRAFNADVPYNQLILEHLAGDLLKQPRLNEKQGFNESVLGTVYFNLGEGKHSPVSLKEEEYSRIDNIIDVTSKTFQALTVGCAKCHDHKFDPIPTTDYYSMYGMFESARTTLFPANSSQIKKNNLKRLIQIKETIRNEVGAHFSSKLSSSSSDLIKRQKKYIEQLSSSAGTSVNQAVIGNKVNWIGDFRIGFWDGWYADGLAFGDKPTIGEPVFKDNQLVGLKNTFASSRFYSKGIIGALRSPNFIVTNDSIAVLAAGKASSIRIIVDNFQLIQDPIYGSLDEQVDDTSWNIYTFDLSMVQGHKAYLEFLPGYFEKHLYSLEPDSYIEVQYAFGFNKGQQVNALASEESIIDFNLEQSIEAWKEQRLAGINSKTLSKIFNPTFKSFDYKNVQPLLDEYSQIASTLFDQEHFPGVTEGDAVFSPVFIRGSINELSEEVVPRQFLDVIKIDSISIPQLGSGRLAWANALAHPKNPLTARVMVNRIWHHLFGTGIVASVDNFGLQGTLPTHPELLDYLALQFIMDGWSVKKMIRNILLSEGFKRSTQSIQANLKLDPVNHYFHQYPVRRLEAEAIRDAILAVAGSLDSTMYGRPVPIYLTEFMTGRGRPRKTGSLDGDGRRSIYQEIRRNFLPPMMLAFDMPIPFSTFGNRNVTNVPAQSLSLLNDPFVHDQASKWAQRLLKKDGLTFDEKINKIYLRALSRYATVSEIADARDMFEKMVSQYNLGESDLEESLQLWADYCHTVFNLKEFIYLL